MSLAYLQQESTTAAPDALWNVAWLHSNNIISASADGHLRIYDSSSLTAPVHTIPSHPLAISSLSVTADGTRALAASLDGTVVAIDTDSGEILGKVETASEAIGEDEFEVPAFACAIHPQGTSWAWAGRGSRIGLGSISAEASSEGQGILSGPRSAVDVGKGKFCMDLQYSPDGRSLAVSTEQGQVIVLDTESQSIVASYNSHNKAVRTITWSPDSQWLFSGSDDKLIVLYDVRAGSTNGAEGQGEGAVATLPGHQSFVLKVAASPDGKLLGSVGADSLVKLWDISQRTCVSTSSTNAEAWGISWQPADAGNLAPGKQFAVAGDDKVVTIYRAAGAV
ncbi:hypothetical protein L202_02729 [Cryptococcus amylolentus CBS 6039]|uniref:Anaphase-promoting complex subunit 4 WD40 domain-containing protein n=1 Tax=Cryptococcus amylolentus CBS 6039 TaxID=1295533 RepID=A0A1E3HW00_9TREE|nr:hypothetical protein L202_02729 [Cryptococcus amylolentus CBS 6039]ODN80498.1 hypothetical protein L202_02729 [Cryptococcus amylolentus CBS 6039]